MNRDLLRISAWLALVLLSACGGQLDSSATEVTSAQVGSAHLERDVSHAPSASAAETPPTQAASAASAPSAPKFSAPGIVIHRPESENVDGDPDSEQTL